MKHSYENELFSENPYGEFIDAIPNIFPRFLNKKLEYFISVFPSTKIKEKFKIIGEGNEKLKCLGGRVAHLQVAGGKWFRKG